MRQGNSGSSRAACRRGNAGNDLGPDSGFGKNGHFFATATEDERIAALQTANVLAVRREPHKQGG